MGATAVSFPSVATSAPSARAEGISGQPTLQAPHAATAARFGHEETRKRHGFYTVSTWFLHGFLRPQAVQPPLTPALAPPEKTLFSATSQTCETNPPCIPSVPSCLRACVAVSLSASRRFAKRTRRPQRLFMFLRFTSSALRTQPDPRGTHPGPLLYAILAPPPPQPLEQSALPRAARHEQKRAHFIPAHSCNSWPSLLRNEPTRPLNAHAPAPPESPEAPPASHPAAARSWPPGSASAAAPCCSCEH